MIRPLVFLAAAGLLAAAAAAQTIPADKAAKEDELKRLNADLAAGRTRIEALGREIETLKADAVRLSRALVDAAARIKAREADMTDAEDRLAALDKSEAKLAGSLANRRDVLAHVLAAMQRIGRQPPPALLARPEDALAAARAALLLSAVLSGLRAQADALAADLAEIKSLQAEIAASRDTLAREAAMLMQERQELARLVEEKKRRRAGSERVLARESKRIEALAATAKSLGELIARMEADLKRRMQGRPAGAFAPALPFAAARGRLALPANGVLVRGFGEKTDRFGAAAKGLFLATRPGAQVTAPCEGTVVHAGPFRTYGQVLIINAGGGYHVVLAGMERIDVALEQFVLAGEPVAIMGEPRGDSVSALAPGAAQPILYVEFRKDGAAIDPTPWWASKSLEKVRG